MSYIGKDNKVYGDMEESILACLLLEPTLTKKLRVDEKYFKKYGYMLTFMKEFYERYKCFDISLMFSVTKGSSEATLLNTITYLLTIFVIPTPTQFEEYQKRLIQYYRRDKKEDWLRKKVYEKACSLYAGNIELRKFNIELNRLYEQADKINWE